MDKEKENEALRKQVAEYREYIRNFLVTKGQTMETSKRWYQSKTIWASLVTVVVGLLGTFGITGVEGEQEAIVETIMQIVAAVAGVVAVIGRLTASAKIDKGMGASVLILFLAMCLFAGCSKVQMSPRYAAELETSAINVAELNRRCQGGDPNACRDGLAVASETLELLVDGLHGRGGDQP